MNYALRFQRRSLTIFGAATVLAALSGCQNHKIIARVNSVAINDDEYDAAVSRVKANDFQALTQQGIPTDAGGAGLVAVVKEKLLEKLAADKNAIPSDDTVNRYIQYLMRASPNVMNAEEAGQLSKDDLPRLVRDQMIRIALGSNNATVPEEDIKKEYDDNKKNAGAAPKYSEYPEMYGLRAVPVPSQAEGIQLINQIKATGDFAAAAAKISPQAGHVTYLFADSPTQPLPAPLKTALNSLKEGQLASAPISLATTPNGPGPLIVVQLVKHMPKGEATLAEAHEAIREMKLQQTQPQIMQHSQEVINEFNQKANIEVYIDRYKNVVKAAMVPPPPSAMGAGAPNGASAPGGAPGGGVRRVMPSPGNAAPSSAPSGAGASPGSAPSSDGGASTAKPGGMPSAAGSPSKP